MIALQRLSRLTEPEFVRWQILQMEVGWPMEAKRDWCDVEVAIAIPTGLFAPFDFRMKLLKNTYFSEGVWVKSHSISGNGTGRVKHVSWSSPNGILLIGGSGTKGGGTSEILTDDGHSSASFATATTTDFSCAIKFDDKAQKFTIGGQIANSTCHSSILSYTRIHIFYLELL